MSSVPVKTFCPLGAECESIKDGAIHRCKWYVEIHGKNPNTDELVKDWFCAMSALPMLTIENSNQQRSTSVAVEDFRNEMVKANQTSQQMLLATVKEAHPEIKVIEAIQ